MIDFRSKLQAKIKPGELALIFDTETTGLPEYRAPVQDDCQPHLVQLAYALATIGGGIHAQGAFIIRPEGWTVPKEAADVHGITTEMAAKYGIPMSSAVSGFAHHVAVSDVLVAHNIKFDLFLLQTALCRLGKTESSQALTKFRRFCTQDAATPLLKLPPTEKMLAAGRRHHKTANLAEAYEFFTGDKLEGAHDALVDVLACRTVLEGIVAGQGRAPDREESPTAP